MLTFFPSNFTDSQGQFKGCVIKVIQKGTSVTPFPFLYEDWYICLVLWPVCPNMEASDSGNGDSV